MRPGRPCSRNMLRSSAGTRPRRSSDLRGRLAQRGGAQPLCARPPAPAAELARKRPRPCRSEVVLHVLQRGPHVGELLHGLLIRLRLTRIHTGTVVCAISLAQATPPLACTACSSNPTVPAPLLTPRSRQRTQSAVY